MKKVLLSALLASSVSLVSAEIRQELGVDQRVDYSALQSLGPWDDRNYQLTQEDLAILPVKDHYLSHVPVFFKVEKRKLEPTIGEFYPRSTLQHFQMLHGGLIVDGIWHKEGLGVGYHPEPKDGKYGKVGGVEVKGSLIDPNTETPLEFNVNGNEVTVECNPVNNLNCVAGSNTTNGQSMYYSFDGGETWTLSQTNPENSCCDPVVDYSLDGSIVYQADLGGLVGLGTRWSRSLDQGVTWAPMGTIAPSGTDKEWIHVDRSPTSPHVDNIYATYHISNTMQFARSTDMGLSFSTPIAFSSEETGIGSDITTDSVGNIYYVYPSTAGGGIRLLKSSDGGLTFDPSVQVSSIVGRFDFPIPAMESRQAFIYVSVDVDSQDNIYVAFTDEADDSVGNGNGSAANNRGVIKVAKSSDGGATWALTTSPHANDGQLNSGNPIDRFHPWLMVAENDAVHIGFYDTRNSVNRTGVDFYYNVSLDGGNSWLPEGEQRYSTETSVNINNGQEWGDYNGLSVVMDKIVMTWTDNRPSIGQTAIAASGENPFAVPGFSLASDLNTINVCSGSSYASTITVGSNSGFNEDVDLSFGNIPGFVANELLSDLVVTAPGTSDLTFDVVAGGTVGVESLTIIAEGREISGGDLIYYSGFESNTDGDPTVIETIDIVLNYADSAPGDAVLVSPADAATGVSLLPTLTWDPVITANQYVVEISDDPTMSNIIFTETVDGATTSVTVSSDLMSQTTFYWRVSTNNSCDVSMSEIRSFTTTSAPGDCPVGQSEVDVIEYDFESGDQGWVTAAQQGAATWTLQSVIVGSGSQAYNSTDLDNTSDNLLTSPVISVPTGSEPYTLRFWNQQLIEDNGGVACWDGGLVEISQDGGAFEQVLGDKMINMPYNGPLSGGPLVGQDAWCGDPLAGLQANVDINDFAGSDIQIRFRMVTDGSVGRDEGWTIDDVRVTGCTSPP